MLLKLFSSLITYVSPSNLPLGTCQFGPPSNATASLAANAIISAHDTTPEQELSIALLISTIVSNAVWAMLFSAKYFYALLNGVEEIMIDASQPYQLAIIIISPE